MNILHLPFEFDVIRLQEDLKNTYENDWVEHHNKQAYTGEWSATSLRSIDGTNREIVALENRVYYDTPLLNKCFYIQQVINTFEAEVEAVRFMKLGAHSVIKEHTDKGSCFEDDLVRLHIPISSNKNVEFIVGGEKENMNAGNCYYMNADAPHSVVNESDEERVHLLLDCRVNDWLREIFKQSGIIQENYKYSSKSINDDNVNEIIENLKIINTEISLHMAQELEQKRDAK